MLPQLPLMCNLCKTSLGTNTEVIEHMRGHFETLVPRHSPDTAPPDPIPDLAQGGAATEAQIDPSAQSSASSGQPARTSAGPVGPDPSRSSWRSRKFPKPDPKQQTPNNRPYVQCLLDVVILIQVDLACSLV